MAFQNGAENSYLDGQKAKYHEQRKLRKEDMSHLKHFRGNSHKQVKINKAKRSRELLNRTWNFVKKLVLGAKIFIRMNITANLTSDPNNFETPAILIKQHIRYLIVAQPIVHILINMAAHTSIYRLAHSVDTCKYILSQHLKLCSLKNTIPFFRV
jgi:hypothetical protein